MPEDNTKKNVILEAISKRGEAFTSKIRGFRKLTREEKTKKITTFLLDHAMFIIISIGI